MASSRNFKKMIKIRVGTLICQVSDIFDFLCKTSTKIEIKKYEYTQVFSNMNEQTIKILILELKP